MVWTREEVDKYVIQVERNCSSPRERNLKGFAFAGLYREASDHDNARRYLEAYISESEGDFRGHRLMGQLYEEKGLLEKAVASYRRSLELNNTQKDLVLKVVKLYCTVPVHPDRARAWADRGARLFPGHADVFHLRLHLLETAESVDFEALEDLISEEVSNRPREVLLHIRLVKLYAVRGRLSEAFSHCVAVMKTKAFKDSLEWYRCCVDVFEKYVSSLEKHLMEGQVIGSGHTILEAHSFLLIALCQLLEQHLCRCDTRDVINVLYRLDHCLFMACNRKIRHSPRKVSSGVTTEWDVVLTEMKAQLYMHCGTLVTRLAKEKFVTWPRGLKLACACYLASIGISEPETKTPWVARAPKNKDPLKWYIMACSRLSRVGHFLMAANDRHGANWLNTCHSDCCSRHGQEEILDTVYRNEKDSTKSFLANDGEFAYTEANLPEVDQLVAWDEVALSEDPRSLQSLIWVGLHWYQYDKEMRPGVGVIVKEIFRDLRMDVPNLEKHITPNMLCLRDLESFLYAVVRTAAARILEDRDVFYEDFEPRVLPVPLCSSLSLPVQEEWWVAAYSLYTGKFSLSESGKTRRIVQLGIEKIRAIDLTHGLQVQLLIYLAKAFGTKASFLKSSGPNPWYYEEHWKSLERWSLHYWQRAIIILEMLEKDESIPHCTKPLFPRLFDALQESDVKSHLQSACLVLGGSAMKEGRIEEAMELFEQVKTPPGMFNLAQIYKYLAHVEARAATEETDTECTGPAQEYYENLKKARELLLAYMKMTDSSDVGRQAVMDELNEIESMIKIGVTHANLQSGTHMRQLSDPESRSSTYVSDVQESEDNFWVEQPQDSSTKDLIAKLSEVTLNNGYLQEQMAIRDETMATMSDQISFLQDELCKLQTAYFGQSPLTGPSSSNQSSTEQNKPVFESTPIAVRQASTAKGPRSSAHSGIKGPLKIDAGFFAGLSLSNSPDVRVEESQEEVYSPVSPGRDRHDSSTSYTEDIHFEPLIPLPEQIEVQTGEEDEEVMFDSRAKLYRYDKDVCAWKERGIGTLKILYCAGRHRCRILMRREIVHKICANHFITTDMKLTEKKGTANSWIWNTVADFSDEVSKPEQLTVKFKTQEDSSLFKETFEECLNILEKEAPVIQGHPSTRAEKGIDLVAKFAPKPGSWTCSICLIMNEEHARICGACGAAKVSDDTPTSSLSPSHKPLPLLGFPSGVSGSAFMFPGLQTTASPSVPFTFGTSDQGKGEPQTDVTTSTFTFVAPDTAVSNEVPGAVVGSQVFGSSAGALPSGTQPLGFSPFKLLDSGSGTSPSKFVFGSSSMTGVSTSSSVPQTFPTTVASPSATRGVPSVFGGASGQGTPISFGSLSTENSPVFNLDSLDISSSGTQTEPLVCEKCEGDNLVTQDATPQPPPQPSVSSSASVQQGMPEQKLFWEKPTGTFQFGQLEEIPPLGGAGAWPGYSNYWYPTQAAAAASGSGSPSSLGNQQTAGASPQPPIPTRFPQGNTSLATSQSLDEFATHSKFSGSELLRHLALAKVQQEALSQVTEDKGYDFTPYVVDEPALPSEATFLPKETKSASTLVVEEYDSENQVTDAANTAETDSSTDETSSYTSTETEDNLAEIEHEIESTMQKPPAQVAQLLPSVMLNQPAVMASPSRPVPFHSAEVMNAGPVPLPSQITGRRFLTARSPLRGAKKQDEDCVLVYEVRPSRSDRETASHLMLPTNFFNYAKREVCPGCHGCKKLASGVQTLKYEVEKEKPHSETPVSSVNEPRSRTGADPVFGQSSDFGQLTFSSFKSQDDSSFTEKTVSFKPFQGAGTQLFGEGNQDTDPDNLHFEPVIPLPDKIKVVTGEEGLEVLFSERAKLYRFDTDLSQWKERGVGDIKLLCNPKSGQGRVLMRREQIKKVCANHNITSRMELKPNVGSDRSWVWYTTADFAEDEPRPEKLAIRFKFTESAVKFKEIFDMLRDSAGAGPSPEKEGLNDQQKERCTLYEHFVSAFVPAPGVWSCEVCYLQNEVGDVACVACSSPQPATRSHALQSVAQASGVELVEAKAFEGTEESAAVLASSSLETSFASVLNNAPLFTIGRGESSDEKADEEVLSPSKISSPSKQHSTAEKPSTPLLQSNAAAGFPFGSNTPTKFTFSLQVSPGSPSRKPKSPPSPASPLSPKSPVYGEDDGPYFEPLIPLPEKIECRTGEEDEEELFCDRCKLYRYDMDSSQWKERGVGDVKILHHKSSAKYRVLMRREHVFKLCANHSISGEMLLKPFPSSDKAWLWKTLADFSEEVAKPETLAAKFRTNAIATEFKDVFDNVLQTLVTTHGEKGPKPKSAGPTPTLEKQKPDVGDVLIMYEQEVSEEQKEKAIRLQLPEHFFAYDKQSPETSHDQSLVVTSNPDQTSTDGAPEEERTPRTSNFLFGSPNVASLSFQSVAASSLGTSPFGQKSPTGFAGQKSPGTPAGFAGAGSTLFSPQSPTDGDTDGPHFEPLIPLPDKIDVKTGEEDEEVMFSHRAKLYRFIAEDKQWKERGVGDIKLLKNKTSGRMRVLMRREQVKKLCANHQITEDMKLQPNAGSDRSWVWSTLADFSEQECRAERLAVRFKMDTTARQFKEKFEECQEMLKQQIPEACKERVTEDIVTQFKPDAGSWECDTCLVMNNSDKTECAACGTHKPGAEPSQTQQTSGKPVFPFGAAASSSGSGFTFGFPGDSSGQKPTFCFGSLSQTSSSTSVSGPNETQEKAADKEEVADDLLVKLKPSAGSWECDTCLVRNNSDKIECAACGTRKPGAEPTQAEQTSGKPVFPIGANTSSTGSGFKFGFLGDSGGQKPTFSFGSLSQTSSSTSASGSNQTQEKVADKEEVVEDLVTQFKPQTGSWECDTCMVRNNSDKAECAACGTLKPGAEPSQAQQTSGKPVLSFGAGTSSSGSGFKFGFSGDSKGKKPDFSFGALSQTSSSTPESTNGFDFAKQEAGSGEDQSVEIKQDVSVSVKQSMNDEKGEVNLGEPSLESQSEEEVTQSVQDIGGSKEELASPEESETTQQDDAEVNKGFMFGSPNVASLSFQSVAASSLGAIPFGQKSPGTPAGFAGAGSTLFASQSPGEDATDGDTEGPHFEPLIPLPEKIEVKTGEEDEEVLFSHRAKLYRFIAEDKQWKERGVGDIKLLKNKTSGRMRVLMRREQVKKLCANHQITEDMKLQPNAGSDRSWVWSTLADFSEQECRAERLAVRFKTDVPAKQFKEKFEECQEMLKQQIPEASKEHVAEDIVTQFKPDAGSWECDTCLLRNNSDKIECAACGTHKPGAEPSQAQQTSGKPVFPFGAGTTSSGSGFKFGLSGNHNGQNQTFTFGSLSQTSSSTSESASNQTQEKAANKEVEAEDLLVKLRPQAGSWDCDTCMVRNNSDTIKCAKCGALKPGADPNQAEQTSDKHVFPFEAGTALSSFGANTSMSSFGADTSMSSFGAGTALSSFGADTSMSSFGAGTALSSFGAHTSLSGSGFNFDLLGQKQTFTSRSSSQTFSSTSTFSRQEASVSENRSVQAKKEVVVSMKKSAHYEKHEVKMESHSLKAQLDSATAALVTEALAQDDIQEYQLVESAGPAGLPAPSSKEILLRKLSGNQEEVVNRDDGDVNPEEKDASVEKKEDLEGEVREGQDS